MSFATFRGALLIGLAAVPLAACYVEPARTVYVRPAPPPPPVYVRPAPPPAVIIRP